MPTPPGGSIRLGSRPISRIGYGAMQLEHLETDAATVVLRRVVDLGITHIDTASFYGDATVNGHLRAALHPYPDDLVLVSKLGARAVDAPLPIAPAQRPDELRRQVHRDLATLGLEQVPVVNLRRLDRTPGLIATGDDVVPLDDQLAELVAMRDEGLIGDIGLSNVDAEQLRQALPAGIVCVQNAYSLLDRSGEDLLEVCRAHDIVWVPFFPLGSAFERMPSPIDDPIVQEVAARHEVGPATVALAWILQHHPHTALIPGTRSIAHLEDNVAVDRLRLDDTDMARLDAVVDPNGTSSTLDLSEGATHG